MLLDEKQSRDTNNGLLLVESKSRDTITSSLLVVTAIYTCYYCPRDGQTIVLYTIDLLVTVCKYMIMCIIIGHSN